jgi:hypothetical protein
MKMYGEWMHPHFLGLGTSLWWLVSSSFSRFATGEELLVLMDDWLCGSQSRSGCYGEETILDPTRA